MVWSIKIYLTYYIITQGQKMKKIIILTFLITVFIFTGCGIQKPEDFHTTYSKIEKIVQKSATIKDIPKKIDKTDLPDSIKIKVPFSPQAPFANWDDDHNEGCEEASVLLAQEFLNGNESADLDKSYADSEITRMISWQRKNWEGHFDLEIERTKELAEKFYGMQNLQIVSINSTNEIKSYLADGKIIITPTAGRELGNPNFRQPGPVYHMLVIKGYDNKNFITNDVGTRKGKDYKYKYDILYSAIRDLPEEARNKEHYIKDHSELIEQGEKKVLIVNK